MNVTHASSCPNSKNIPWLWAWWGILFGVAYQVKEQAVCCQEDSVVCIWNCGSYFSCSLYEVIYSQGGRASKRVNVLTMSRYCLQNKAWHNSKAFNVVCKVLEMGSIVFDYAGVLLVLQWASEVKHGLARVTSFSLVKQLEGWGENLDYLNAPKHKKRWILLDGFSYQFRTLCLKQR